VFAIPLFDDAPMRRPSVLVWLIIIACAAVFLWQLSLPPAAERDALISLGFVPARLFGYARLPPRLDHAPAWTTIFTSMFLHGGWLHIAGNMLYLWIFGNNVEDAMSRPRFLLFYLLCGAAAALAHGAAAPASTAPMIGASGAIAGVLGAYFVLHPRANVRVLLILVVFIRVINVPAVIVLGLWFLVQFVSIATTPSAGGDVAFWAHAAGFLAGIVLIPFFRDRDVPLFAGPYSPAFAVLRPRNIEPRGVRRSGSVPDAGGTPWRRRGPWER
jgi:membrane associated rhomboid family serine protease